MIQNCRENLPLILLGNKADLFKTRQVTKLEALTLASKLNCAICLETSSFTGVNIHEGFMTLIE
jgi:GTPase SAR1 family protein